MITYKIKLLALPDNAPTIVVQLIPTNDEDLSPLRRTIHIPTVRLQEISALPNELEQLTQYRFEVLKGDSGYQSDWEAQKIRRSVNISEALKSRIGDEFPEVTEAELMALHEELGTVPESTTDEVVL